ncbi:hypothetical protein [Luteolibacter sp. Populi]|uniref:hypothetical protein n=1 Tax=Luteolibacter sp. Populi TaxID=3230487 RepID=UPI00346661CF
MKSSLAFLLLASGTLHSQEAAAKHTLRVLPLGDPPPFIQEVRGGVRYEVPAQEGAIPPRNILLSAPAPAKDEATKEPLPLRLRLGMPSPELVFPLPEGRTVTTTLQAGGSWLTIPLSTAESTLAFVWRGGKDWFQPRVLSIPDDAKEGDFRFVNLTGKPMGLTWGTEKIKLNPATTLTRQLPQGTAVLPISIQYPAADGTLRPCLSTQVERAAATRNQFVIYAADSKESKMPVKVLSLSERL